MSRCSRRWLAGEDVYLSPCMLRVCVECYVACNKHCNKNKNKHPSISELFSFSHSSMLRQWKSVWWRQWFRTKTIAPDRDIFTCLASDKGGTPIPPSPELKESRLYRQYFFIPKKRWWSASSSKPKNVDPHSVKALLRVGKSCPTIKSLDNWLEIRKRNQLQILCYTAYRNTREVLTIILQVVLTNLNNSSFNFSKCSIHTVAYCSGLNTFCMNEQKLWNFWNMKL